MISPMQDEIQQMIAADLGIAHLTGEEQKSVISLFGIVALKAATAAAEPPDDPPGTRVVSCGFFVILNAEFSVDDPMANSSMFVFPRKTACWALSFLITPAS